MRIPKSPAASILRWSNDWDDLEYHPHFRTPPNDGVHYM